MKGYWLSSIAGTGLLLFTLGAGQAAAQYHDDEGWHHNREGYYRGQEWRMHLFDRVREDLDHVESTGFRWGDRARVERARHELNDLQGKLAARQFDERELDDTIGALQQVVADNRMGPRDREILNEDLNRLREYREHHDQWYR